MQAQQCCFHCGEPVPADPPVAEMQGTKRPFCCAGCLGAAQLIRGLGLESYYKWRAGAPAPAGKAVPSFAAFDEQSTLRQFARGRDGSLEVVLSITGLTCAACGWLVTRAVESLGGIENVSVNAATGRARICFDPARVSLSLILGQIARLGYEPVPLTADESADRWEALRRSILKRLGVAALGMMQVMMFAVALYVGGSEMDAPVRTYLRLISLLVVTPVLIFCGSPFFKSALHALRRGMVTMDVPVSAALLLAFGASVLNCWRRQGEVYFDSITMFLFFLTLARYLEAFAQHQSLSVSQSLGRLLPLTAHRLGGEGRCEDVPCMDIRIDDRVQVRVGEIVPADGLILEGASRLDESMMSGEGAPVSRRMGDTVRAGTMNLEAPLTVQVVSVGESTALSRIVALLHQAQTERPRLARTADRIAQSFLVRVLIGALVVCVLWCLIDPSRAFDATLAVLVVACPCALSLAPLVVAASASVGLARRGLLVAHPDAIERLSKIDQVIFDKTGTLTEGKPTVRACHPLRDLDVDQCQGIAAALEAASEHPLSRAFRSMVGDRGTASQPSVHAGEGVEGIVGSERYRLGRRDFAAALAPIRPHVIGTDEGVYLGSHEGLLARFEIRDPLRTDAIDAIRALKAQGLRTELLSGDSHERVRDAAHRCGMDAHLARQSPEEKLGYVRRAISQGAEVAMVGDGINDAPVLAGASVSIAMGQGTALAQASADLIICGEHLTVLPEAILLARRARRVLRQNLAWAATYNLTCIPLAAIGLIPPWLAAIGMSFSSVLVVLNALRLSRRPSAVRSAIHTLSPNLAL